MSGYTLIIPDVHERIERLKAILAHYHDADRVVFLGDFLDSFNSTVESLTGTVNWLAENAANPKYTFIWGNHDIQYAFPDVRRLRCSGHDLDTRVYTQMKLNWKEHWKHFRLSTTVQRWLCSHAGFRERVPTMGEQVAALILLDKGEVPLLLQAGKARGGCAEYGGCIWLDWDKEFVPVPRVQQIVGHTRHKEPQTLWLVHSVNHCLDTDLRYVGLVSDQGIFKTEEWRGQ